MRLFKWKNKCLKVSWVTDGLFHNHEGGKFVEKVGL